MAKILVVEDSSDMRQMMRDLLGTLGHEVVEAADGLEGVIVALRTHPDLIILDLMMPLIPGGSFLDFKHDTPGIQNIPVLIVSAHSEAHEVARKHGAEGWMTKPVRILELSNRITAMLSVEHD
ncbi:MAG: response regulator transcription factor [Anaerolineae bacterium]|nr:response regulator transcription factor [Anaerolineae bacterium]